MHIFADNTLAQYTVHLPTPLELSGDYEVGLAELQYPQSWDNVRRGSNTIQLYIHYSWKREKDVIIEKEVPPGYYHTVEELIDVIKRIYGSTNRENVTLEGLDIDYNAVTRRVSINTDNMKLKIRRANGKVGTAKTTNVFIKLNDDVARVLGFKNETMIEAGKRFESDFAATPTAGFHQMYIYTDIIHPQPHPDVYVPILRTIAVEGKPNQEYLSRRFQKIFYMPLMKHTITTIDFKIADDIGKLVGFDYGKVLVILHFRRKKL